MNEDEEEDMEESWNVEQIQNCVTLAGLPPARWQNLHNLDVIKARNKPKEAVQKAKNAPFFLPTGTYLLIYWVIQCYLSVKSKKKQGVW